MKRNSLLARSLTLGLAVATAAASMSTTGGLAAPETVYAGETDETGEKVKLSADNLSSYFKLGNAIILVNDSGLMLRGAEMKTESIVTEEQLKSLYGNLEQTYTDSEGNDVEISSMTAGTTYKVYINVDGSGSVLAAADDPVYLGDATAYTVIPDSITLTYKDGADDTTGVTDLTGKKFRNDVIVSTSEGTISTTATAGTETSVTITRESVVEGGPLVALYVTKGDTTYATVAEIRYADITAPTLSDIAAPAADKITAEGATLSVTSNEAGKVYYVVKDAEATSITATSIKEDSDVQTVNGITANTAADITLTGLDPNKTYYVYAVAEDSDENLSDVKSVSFTTKKAALGATAQIKKGDAVLSNAPVVGDELTAALSSEVTGVTPTYQWYSKADEGDGTAIDGATAASYTVTKADIGKKLYVVISGGASYEPATSAQTAAVTKKACTVTAPSALSVGGDHKLTFTVAAGTTATQLQYSTDGGVTWTNGADTITVDGTSASVQLPTDKSYAADTICVRIAETDDTAAGETVKYSGIVKAAFTATVTLSGTMKYGQTITVTATGAPEDAQLKYQFIRVTPAQGETPASVENIGSASATATYTLTKDDIGKMIRVKVTADNYDGAAESDTGAVVAKADKRPVSAPTVASKSDNGSTFTYTLQALAGSGAKYAVLKGDQSQAQNPTIDWKDTVAFDSLDPNETYTFFATYDQTDECYETSDIMSTVVTIDQLTHDALTLDYDVANDGEGGDKKVTITSVTDAEYTFDGTTYSGTNEKTFTAADLAQNSSITIGIRYTDYEGNGAYKATAPITQTIDISKDAQTAPSAATLTAAPNAGKTAYDITVTEPSVSEGETLEYSTDGVIYGALSAITTTGLPANTTFTLYVRKAETTTKNASAGVAASATTPAASVSPTISGDTTFDDKTTVTLTSSNGGTIYYTTDGTAPTTASTEYTAAFDVSATTTVRAIAVEAGKIVSAEASETFTKNSGSTGGSTSGSTGGSTSGSTGGSTSGSTSGSTTGGTTSGDKDQKDNNTKTETKPDGTVVTTTETKNENGTSTTKQELKNEKTGLDATITVSRDAEGNVTDVDIEATQVSSDSSAAFTAELISQLTGATGVTDAEIELTVEDEQGNELFTLTANASDIKAGKKLKVLKVDEKTGKMSLVNKSTYKVDKDGNVVFTDLDQADYQVVTAAEANAFSKQVLQTVKPAKSKKNVTAGKKTKFTMSSALDMDNVAKITYKTSKKSVANVNKNGTITTKKAGKVTVTAKVTLNNGKTKTIKMTVTVKKPAKKATKPSK